MAQIGRNTPEAPIGAALKHGRTHARRMPDLLIDAHRIVQTVISGWHGRRRAGVGDQFWQFRPFVDGDSMSRIDWRRSARDTTTFIREREWEAAHTVWLWADRSASMRFLSELSPVSKEERGLVLAFAMAELLSASGERIAWPGLAAPLMARNAAERIAARLEHDVASDETPDLSSVRAHADVVIFSDFLDLERSIAWLEPLSARRVRAHLVEVADPAEEVFPYRGHTTFTDPETGARLSLGRAESLAEDYRRLYLARREELSRWASRLGWTYTLHRTDRPASQTLVSLHQLLGPAGNMASAFGLGANAGKGGPR